MWGIKRTPPGSQRKWPDSIVRAWSSLLRWAVAAASKKTVFIVKLWRKEDLAGSKGALARL